MMKTSKALETTMQYAITAAACAWMLASGATALAQNNILPIPFATGIAGQAPGGATTPCATTLPTAAAFSIPGDGCPATQATFNGPYGSAVDSYGNVYIGDYNVYALRVLYMGGTALSAAIQAANPTQTFTPQVGYIYTLAGSRQSTIATTQGTTGGKKYYCNSAGSGLIATSSNGDACPATYGYIKPRNPVIDADGNVIFTSGSGSAPVRVVYIGGSKMANLITLLNPGIGTPQPGFIYSIIKSAANGYAGDGALATDTSVHTYAPRDVALDSAGNIYLSDGTNSFTAPAYASDNNIRKVDATTGIISTYAGSAGCAQVSTTGCAGSLSGDGGLATSATFNSPYTIFFDKYDNLYITDYNNDRIRVVYNSGTVPGLTNLVAGNVYTVVGGGTTSATVATSNATATSLAFGAIYTGGIDSGGNIYFVDGTSKLLWRVDAKTGITNYVGGGRSTSSTAAGQACGTGPALLTLDKLADGCPATQVSIVPSGKLPFDRFDNFYEIENGNALLRKFSWNTPFPATNVGSNTTEYLAYLPITTQTAVADTFTLDGAATTEYTDAGSTPCAGAANVTCVFGVRFAPAGAGLRRGTLQLSNGTTNLASASLGGTGVAANISIDPATTSTTGTALAPSGVATDLNGNLFIADTTSNQIFKVATSGGTPQVVASGFSSPAQIAVDGKGNLFVADTNNNRIAEVRAGTSTIQVVGSGFSKPQGIVADQAGNIYVADTGNNRIVEVTPLGGQFVLATSGLSSPTKLAFDGNSNLYIADTGNNRVVLQPLASEQSTVNLGTSTITPNGIAVDAAGDLYVADSVSGQVLEYAPGVTNPDALVTDLTGPRGLAIDVNGSLYIADASAQGVIVANRNNPATSFPNTNLNTSNSAQLNVVNTGNAPLLFNGGSFATATGDTAPFSISAASSNGCALSTAVAAGGQCGLIAAFAPTATGTFNETATFVTNTANVGQAKLSGVAVFLVSTSTALAITQPTTSTISYAQPVTISATVMAASNAGAAPSGPIQFSVDGKKQTAQTLPSSGVLTLTINPAVGIHAVSVLYSGDTLYASSSNSISFTVQKAATATTLSITPGATATPILTLAATVASTTASGETGTVTFYSGSTQIGSAPVDTNGVASITSTSVYFTTYSFTAVYSGDQNFNASTSTAVVPPAQFFLQPGSTSVLVPQGGVATINTTLTPLFNYTGTITASCSGLPANSVCRYSPVSVTFTTLAPNTQPVPQTFSVYIYTNVDSNIAALGGRWNPLVYLTIFFIAALVWRRRNYALKGLTLALLLSACAFGMNGCSTGQSHAISPYITPQGTSTVTITLKDSAGKTQAFNIALTVAAPYTSP